MTVFENRIKNKRRTAILPKKELADILGKKKIVKTMIKQKLSNIIEENEYLSNFKERNHTFGRQYTHNQSPTHLNLNNQTLNKNVTDIIPSFTLLSPANKNDVNCSQTPKLNQSLSKNVNLIITPINYDSTPQSTKTGSSYISPSQILRKFNLNPNKNNRVEKKLFLFQIKNALLQAKKLCLSREFQQNGVKQKPNYYDIFSNYSNIKMTETNDIEKFDDENIKINNYVIFKSKLLGKGGYSSVYLCQDLNTNKDYAVKVTEKNTRANKLKKKYDYVKEEVMILKRIHSQYIVQVYEVIETKKDIYIIMEYMKNNSLFNAIKSLTGFQVWRYFRNLICAVEHCHEIGKIVHRDINVNNLLISENDTVKLSDFGISVILEDDNDLLPCNSGPSTYTPPEKVFSVSPFYHGKPADIWLIGVTLFHMIYKKPLFTDFGNLTKENYTNIELPQFEEIDVRIKELLLSLLAFDPSKRPTFQDLQRNKWITHDDEFPLPDVHEEALEYCYQLSSNEIIGIIDNEQEEQENEDYL